MSVDAYQDFLRRKVAMAPKLGIEIDPAELNPGLHPHCKIPETTRHENFRVLADELMMLATQLREAADGEGDPPHPWRLDDWLACYRHAFDTVSEATHAPA